MKSKVILSVLLFSATLSFAQGVKENEGETKKSELMNFEVSVAPNPSNGSFKIDAPEGAKVMISTVSGTYVGTWLVEKDGLYMQDLPAGSYLIMINSKEAVLTKKLLVL